MQPEFLLFDNVGLCGHCIVTDPSPLMPPQVIYLNNLKALVRLLVVCVQKRMNNCSVWVNLVHFLGQNPFSLVWWISHNGRQSIWYALCINKASTRFRLRMVCVHVHWHLWASKYSRNGAWNWTKIYTADGQQCMNSTSRSSSSSRSIAQSNKNKEHQDMTKEPSSAQTSVNLNKTSIKSIIPAFNVLSYQFQHRIIHHFMTSSAHSHNHFYDLFMNARHGYVSIPKSIAEEIFVFKG